MPSTGLRQQLQHMEWADAALWRAILMTEPARSDGRTRELLYHVHIVQQFYLQLVRGEPLSVPEASSFADLEALHAWARSFYAPVQEYVASLTPDALPRLVPVPWADQLVERFGTVREPTLEQCLLQVVLHTAHHRAQLCTRLRELGGEPPLVDFIAWVWQGQPAPEWPGLRAV